MAEASLYSFELTEATTALLKAQGIHEGIWTIGIEFGFSAALFGMSEQDARPTAVLQVNKINIARQPAGPAPGISVDAAVVNPRPKTLD